MGLARGSWTGGLGWKKSRTAEEEIASRMEVGRARRTEDGWEMYGGCRGRRAFRTTDHNASQIPLHARPLDGRHRDILITDILVRCMWKIGADLALRIIPSSRPTGHCHTRAQGHLNNRYFSAMHVEDRSVSCASNDSFLAPNGPLPHADTAGSLHQLSIILDDQSCIKMAKPLLKLLHC